MFPEQLTKYFNSFSTHLNQVSLTFQVVLQVGLYEIAIHQWIHFPFIHFATQSKSILTTSLLFTWYFLNLGLSWSEILVTTAAIWHFLACYKIYQFFLWVFLTWEYICLSFQFILIDCLRVAKDTSLFLSLANISPSSLSVSSLLLHLWFWDCYLSNHHYSSISKTPRILAFSLSISPLCYSNLPHSTQIAWYHLTINLSCSYSASNRQISGGWRVGKLLSFRKSLENVVLSLQSSGKLMKVKFTKRQNILSK